MNIPQIKRSPYICASKKKEKMKVLMVCLGNICRSPMADGWLRKVSEDRSLGWIVDSAGTANYHIGSKPDSRMRKWAAEAGVPIDSLRARQFTVQDFDDFDIIFAMDQSNLRNILSLARNEADRKKVRLYLNELHPNEDREVPDPYYGTDADFKHVIELLRNATEAFVNNEFNKK